VEKKRELGRGMKRLELYFIKRFFFQAYDLKNNRHVVENEMHQNNRKEHRIEALTLSCEER